VGVIRTGAAADLLLLDQDLALQAVFVDGVRISD
jgi:N-acetylglucosamine-6-phosphate deacetylase